MSSIHSDHMIARHYRMLMTGEFSDLTIFCCGEKFKVHRLILCPASKFFQAASEKKFREGETGIICLEEDKLEAFKRMLSYLYTLDYEDQDGVNPLNMPETVCADDSTPQQPEQSDPEGVDEDVDERPGWHTGRHSPGYEYRGWQYRRWRRRDQNGFGSDNDSDFESDYDSDIERDFFDEEDFLVSDFETDDEIREGERAQQRMLNNVHVYALAEKYYLPELKELAVEKFRRDACKCPLEGLAFIAHEAYASTPNSDRGLRDIVIQMCETHLDQIMEDKNLEAFMRDNADFASDMFKVATGKYKKQLKATEDLRHKIKIKKEKVGRLMKKKRDLSEVLDDKKKMIRYIKTQHHNLTEANNFATLQLMCLFIHAPSRCKKDMECTYCGETTARLLEWEDHGEYPYLIVTCYDCNWRDRQKEGNRKKKEALSIEDLDKKGIW